MKRLVVVIFAVLLMSMPPAAACQFDTDCSPGSRCVKESGSIYGVCVGGIFPGNDHDNSPADFPLDVGGTYGDTCMFDTDCASGRSCIKSSGSIYGTCM